MKRMKISLAALAFVLATGAAFATKSETKVSATCLSPNPEVFDESLGRIECPGEGQACCNIGTTNYFKS